LTQPRTRRRRTDRRGAERLLTSGDLCREVHRSRFAQSVRKYRAANLPLAIFFFRTAFAAVRVLSKAPFRELRRLTARLIRAAHDFGASSSMSCHSICT